MSTAKLAASLPVMLALILGAAPARAETEDCTAITALPAVISTQGIYCFTGNLATAISSGNAIDIQTNNVVLDLNGFKLGGLGAGPGTGAVGIHASDRQNITLKNGTIRGFFKAILLGDAGASQGHLVEDIRADQNTYVGIDVRGAGTIIRNNQVVATGGTTTFGLNADAFGILAFGQGPRVLNNDVINTAKQGTGTAWGIFLNSVTGGLVVNNRITGADRGIEFNGTGKYRDNLIFDVTTPYTGGTLPGLFEKPNPWNKDLSALPVSSRSAAITTALISLGGWGNGNNLQIDFSIPVLYADNTTPRGTISAALDYYVPDGDATPLQMPLPLNGNTEGSADSTYDCDTVSNDCHVLVVERSQKKLYELYHATGTTSAMTALGAFVWDLTKQYTDALRGEQCTSADAAGLPMAALIPTADEVAAGDVPHAIRFILPNERMKADVYVHPATHAGGPTSLNPDAPPYGVRFRLKSTFDEAPYNANARVILRALKKYGMILSDGGNIALTFADDRLSTAKWATLDIDAQTFNSITVSQFDVVDLGNEIILTYNCVREP